MTNDRKIYTMRLFRGKYKNQIIWGNYETFEITQLDRLSNITFTSDINSNDKSPRNVNFLYTTLTSFNSNIKIEYDDSNNLFKTNSNFNKFIGITLLTIQTELIKELNNIKRDEECLIDYISEILYLQIGDKDNLNYCIFGVLSANDLCIISFSNSITEIIKFIEEIQVVTLDDKYVFNTIFALVSCGNNMIDFKKNNNENKIDTKENDDEDEYFSENENGYASIQLTYKCYNSFDYIINSINKYIEIFDESGKYKDNINVFSTLGEYNIVIQLPIKYLNMSLYKEEGILNPASKEYKNLFYQCNTVFSIKKSKVEIINNNDTNNIKNSENKMSNKVEKLCDKIEKLENEIKKYEIVTNNKYLHHIINLLFIDFKKILNTEVRYIKDDVYYQYYTILDILSKLLENKIYKYYIKDKNVQLEILDICNQLINMFNQNVHHIVQSSYFDLEAPVTYFKNTSSYDKIFIMYYGIIKLIIESIYFKNVEAQSELVPFITIDIVEIPKSIIYCDISLNTLGIPESTIYCDTNLNDFKKRIIQIYLPLDAWSNIKLYTPLLVHEMGHYICPKDRYIRNKYMLIIILSYTFSNLLKSFVDNKYIKYDKLQKFIQTINNKYDTIAIDWIKNKVDCNNLNNLFKEEDFYKEWKTFLNEYIIQIFINPNKYRQFIYIFDKFIKDIDNKIHLGEDIDEFLAKVDANKIIDSIKEISSGIREASADMYMISFCDMNITTYIAYIIIARLRQNLVYDNTELSCVRIGSILNKYVLLKNQELPKFEDIRDIINKISGQDFKKDNIKACYDNIKDQFNEYMSAYSHWGAIINEIINNSTLSSSDNNNYDIINTIMKNFDANNTATINEYIKIINRLIIQKSLLDINELYNNREFEEISKECIRNLDSSKKYKNYFSNIKIASIGELNEILLQVRDIISDDNSETIWYRGQRNVNWGLVPKLFRQYSNNNDFYSKYIQAYENFRAKAYESIEFSSVNINTEADWIAFMQHYLIPTQFLDWTEQLLTALYFTLENYFNSTEICPFLKSPILETCEKEKVENSYHNDMVIYVLNPARMNRMLHGEFNNDNFISPIPNLSIKYNAQKYKDYLLPNKSTVTIENIKSFVATYKDINNKLPLAIFTSELSSRLRSQKGHFITFNFLVKNNNIQELFDINKIQDELYNQYTIEGKEFKPFLFKIIIPFGLKKDIHSLVKDMGISISSIYPELANIGTDITNKIFNN